MSWNNWDNDSSWSSGGGGDSFGFNSQKNSNDSWFGGSGQSDSFGGGDSFFGNSNYNGPQIKFTPQKAEGSGTGSKMSYFTCELLPEFRRAKNGAGYNVDEIRYYAIYKKKNSSGGGSGFDLGGSSGGGGSSGFDFGGGSSSGGGFNFGSDGGGSSSSGDFNFGGGDSSSGGGSGFDFGGGGGSSGGGFDFGGGSDGGFNFGGDDKNKKNSGGGFDFGGGDSGGFNFGGGDSGGFNFGGDSGGSSGGFNFGGDSSSSGGGFNFGDNSSSGGGFNFGGGGGNSSRPPFPAWNPLDMLLEGNQYSKIFNWGPTGNPEIINVDSNPYGTNTLFESIEQKTQNEAKSSSNLNKQAMTSATREDVEIIAQETERGMKEDQKSKELFFKDLGDDLYKPPTKFSFLKYENDTKSKDFEENEKNDYINQCAKKFMRRNEGVKDLFISEDILGDDDDEFDDESEGEGEEETIHISMDEKSPLSEEIVKGSYPGEVLPGLENLPLKKANHGLNIPTRIGGKVNQDFPKKQGVIEPSPNYSFSPRLTKPGYYCKPSIQVLSRLDITDLKNVRNFEVYNNFGRIVWNMSVDIVNLDLDKIVSINQNFVEVYPNETEKPTIGNGLNKSATISLYNIFPKKKSKNPDEEYDDEVIEKFVKKLKNNCEKRNCYFIGYDPRRGVWEFKVPHFSRYGLDSEDDSSEEETVKKDKKINEKGLENKKQNNLIGDDDIKMDDKILGKKFFSGLPAEDSFYDDGEEKKFDIRKIAKLEGEELEKAKIEFQRLHKMDNDELKILLDAFGDEEDELFEEVQEINESKNNAKGANLFLIGDQFKLVEKNDDIIMEDKITRETPGLNEIDDFVKLDEMRKKEREEKNDFFFPVFQKAKKTEFKPNEEIVKDFIRNNFSEEILKKFGKVIKKDEESINERMMKMAPKGGAVFSKTGELVKFEPYKGVISFHEITVEPDQEYDYTPKYLDDNVLSYLKCFYEHSTIYNEEYDEGFILPKIKLRKESVTKLISDLSIVSKSLCLEHKNDENYKEQFLVFDLVRKLYKWYVDFLEEDFEKRNFALKKIVSDWLYDSLKDDIKEEAKKQSTSYLKALVYMSGNQTDKAAKILYEAGCKRISLIVAQNSNESIRKDMENQLKGMQKDEKFMTEFDAALLKIYYLLSGKVDQCNMYDWKRNLGMIFWYKFCDTNTSVWDILEDFEEMITDGFLSEIVPPYLESFLNHRKMNVSLREVMNLINNKDGKYGIPRDICYEIIKLFSSVLVNKEGEDKKRINIKFFLDPITHTSRIIDYRTVFLLWHVFQVMDIPYFKCGSVKFTNDVIDNFVLYLEKCGIWEWGVWAQLFLCCQDSKQITKKIKNYISRMLKLDDFERENFLVQVCKVPKRWIHKSKALIYKNKGDDLMEIYHLLLGEKYELAHTLTVRSVAPKLVLRFPFYQKGKTSDEFSKLLSILEKLEECKDEVVNWKYRGSVYMDYLNLRFFHQELVSIEKELEKEKKSSVDNFSEKVIRNTFEKKVEKKRNEFLTYLTKFTKQLNGKSFEICDKTMFQHEFLFEKVCTSKMEDWTSKRIIETYKNLHEKKKMDENFVENMDHVDEDRKLISQLISDLKNLTESSRIERIHKIAEYFY